MRVFMPDPENAPMCAATATCSPALQEVIVAALKIQPDYYSINLGCWRQNLQFSRLVMEGGQTSYTEVSRLFSPRPERFEDTQQSLVFAADYVALTNLGNATKLLVRKLVNLSLFIIHFSTRQTRLGLKRNFERGRFKSWCLQKHLQW
jgi:hypothetical protein